MLRPEDPPQSNDPADAYEAYWTAAEGESGISGPLPPRPESDPEDTYAAFRDAADE